MMRIVLTPKLTQGCLQERGHVVRVSQPKDPLTMEGILQPVSQVYIWRSLKYWLNCIAFPSRGQSSPYPTRQSAAIAVVPPGKPRDQPTSQDHLKRLQFLDNLKVLGGISLTNDIDNESPPTTFQFIQESILGKGVYRATEEVMLGCTCQNKYKQQFGCVYLDWCTCIQDSGEDDKGKKSFSYGASEKNYRCLRPSVLQSRNHIYECNSKCDCTQNCKNRVVQHGRQVQLDIFKTTNRGWGSYSLFVRLSDINTKAL